MKKYLAFACKNLIFFILMIILQFSEISIVSSFCDGFFASLVLLKENVYILSLMYIISGLIYKHTIESIIISCWCSFVMICYNILMNSIKKKFSLSSVSIALVIGQIARIYFAFISKFSYLAFINIIFALMTLYVSFIALNPIITYKLRYKLMETEGATICIMLVILGIGLSKIYYKISLLYIFAGAICVLVSVLSSRNTLVIALSCIGIGSAFSNGDIKSLALMSFIGVIVSLFYSRKLFVLLSGLMAITIFELFFFTGFDRLIYNLLSFAIGGVIAIILPKKFIVELKKSYFTPHTKLAMRNLINRNRKALSCELTGFGEIFRDMSLVLKRNFGSCDKQEREISIFLRDNVCKRCTNFNQCNSQNLEESILQLVNVTMEKGRATVVDLPTLVQNNCIHLAQLISLTADKVIELKKSREKQENNFNYKKNLSVQLDGIQNILYDMADSISKPVSYDLEKEKILRAELNSHNIVCSEATVIQGEKGEINLLIKTDTITKELIEKVIYKLLHIKYTIKSMDNSLISGYSMVSLVPLTIYDVVFGCSSLALHDEIGDTHSFTKIGGHRFMMALCDGMGSGAKANFLSETAIGLVESFYKVGMDSEIILQSINRFLSLSSDESFSAMDILVVDLNSGEGDMIKIGSPSSFIKKSESVDVIDGCCLPLGLIENIQPTVSYFTLSDEFVIFVSDGVSDCFKEDELGEYINNLTTKNPQTMSSTILNYAIESIKTQKDDMTVLVAKIFKR